LTGVSRYPRAVSSGELKRIPSPQLALAGEDELCLESHRTRLGGASVADARGIHQLPG